MRIYTSYYAKVSKHYDNARVLVRISKSKPAWFTEYTYELECLYPHWDLIQGLKSKTLNWDEYRERYLHQLSFLSRNDVLKMLEKISIENGGKDIILLCWEKPEEHCHRHLVAEWLDYDITEL